MLLHSYFWHRKYDNILNMLAAAALKLNTGLRELYLSDNDLDVTDAIQLGGILRSNFTLQLLDIR